jgi:hypothetical protein
LHTCWLLVLEEYGLIFEYLPRNKNVGTVALTDALSRLDIDVLKIQEEDALTLRIRKTAASVMSNQ